jgi:hypothetical protein
MPAPGRFFFIRCLLMAVGTLLAISVGAQTEKAVEPVIEWHDVTTWDIEGREWVDEQRQGWFDRLPQRAEGAVTDRVWELSRSTVGMVVRFRTDSDEILLDYVLSKGVFNGVNTSPIGHSGFDMYARDEAGEWRWVESAGPREQTGQLAIARGLASGEREYALHLPSFNGLEALSIGVSEVAKFQPLPPRQNRPIVFYGTSINHGASASRAGMVHTAILGRWFDRPVVNLGFNGNGRMDAAVGELMGDIDAAVYVIDCLPNMNAAAVLEKCVPLVKQLRAAQPDIPIVLVEDRRNTNAWVFPDRSAHHDANHAALKKCYAELRAAGFRDLYYIEGDNLLGNDGEGTADGSHPSDLGFWRQAKIFEPILRQALMGR